MHAKNNVLLFTSFPDVENTKVKSRKTRNRAYEGKLSHTVIPVSKFIDLHFTLKSLLPFKIFHRIIFIKPALVAVVPQYIMWKLIQFTVKDPENNI